MSIATPLLIMIALLVVYIWVQRRCITSRTELIDHLQSMRRNDAEDWADTDAAYRSECERGRGL